MFIHSKKITWHVDKILVYFSQVSFISNKLYLILSNFQFLFIYCFFAIHLTTLYVSYVIERQTTELLLNNYLEGMRKEPVLR